MRVKISTNAPLPPLRAWIPVAHASTSTSTVSSFKSLLCTSLPAFRDVSPSSLHLSIDGFELLDSCELTIVRDGDLISVDLHEEDANTRLQSTAQATCTTRPEPSAPAPSRKRKRRSMPSPSGFESETECTSGSESTTSTSTSTSSDSESESESTSDSGPARPSVRRKLDPHVQRLVYDDDDATRSTFVPPGHGKPQTRARNLRRRLKRMHEREAAEGSVDGPVSGANAVVAGQDAPRMEAVPDPPLMSLSLRNKNKAKNFRSLIGRPLPAKIIFGEQAGLSTDCLSGARQGVPRLIPPSERSSLPLNMFVTSVDVEAELHGKGKRRKMAEVVVVEEPVEVEEAKVNERWDTLEKPTRERVKEGTLVGYKALGIDPMTYTPGKVLTVGRVESCGCAGLVMRPLRAVSFGGPAETEAVQYPWEEIESDWRVIGLSVPASPEASV